VLFRLFRLNTSGVNVKVIDGVISVTGIDEVGIDGVMYVPFPHGYI